MTDTVIKLITETYAKDDSGVPQSRSTKVSRYQKAIDEARKDTPTFSTSAFGGVNAISF